MKLIKQIISIPISNLLLYGFIILVILAVAAPKLSDNIGANKSIGGLCFKKFKIVMDKAVEYEAANGKFPTWKELNEEDHDKYWNYSSFIKNDTFYVRGTLRKPKVFDGVPKGSYLQKSIHGEASSNCKLFYTKYFKRYLGCYEPESHTFIRNIYTKAKDIKAIPAADTLIVERLNIDLLDEYDSFSTRYYVVMEAITTYFDIQKRAEQGDSLDETDIACVSLPLRIAADEVLIPKHYEFFLEVESAKLSCFNSSPFFLESKEFLWTEIDSVIEKRTEKLRNAITQIVTPKSDSLIKSIPSKKSRFLYVPVALFLAEWGHTYSWVYIEGWGKDRRNDDLGYQKFPTSGHHKVQVFDLDFTRKIASFQCM